MAVCPRGHQVVDDQAHAQVVVVADHVGPQPLGAGGGDHHRHVTENLRKSLPVRDGPDDQHRLDTKILERADRTTVDPRARGGPRRHHRTDQQRAQALVLEHLTGPLDHVDQQRVPQVGHQHTDGLGPDIGQRTRRQVHPVAELVGGLLDPPPLVLAHHRLTPHHQRDQRFRHARPARRRLGSWADGRSSHRVPASDPLPPSSLVGPVQYDRLHIAASRRFFDDHPTASSPAARRSTHRDLCVCSPS